MWLTLIEHGSIVISSWVGTAVGIRSLRRKMDEHMRPDPSDP